MIHTRSDSPFKNLSVSTFLKKNKELLAEKIKKM